MALSDADVQKQVIQPISRVQGGTHQHKNDFPDQTHDGFHRTRSQ